MKCNLGIVERKGNPWYFNTLTTHTINKNTLATILSTHCYFLQDKQSLQLCYHSSDQLDVSVLFLSSHSSTRLFLNSSFAGDTKWPEFAAQHVTMQCNVLLLTILVARLVDQTGLVCQQRVDLDYFSRQWRIQLTGGLHALQGAKLICRQVTENSLHFQRYWAIIIISFILKQPS